MTEQYVGKLQFGDVVTSPLFAFAEESTRFSGDPLEIVPEEFCNGRGNVDPSRGTARFIVLYTAMAGETRAFGGPGSAWREIYLVRLPESALPPVNDEDGPERPEVIKFNVRGHINKVNLVGRASFNQILPPQ